jgi:phage pi2 protein 07
MRKLFIGICMVMAALTICGCTKEIVSPGADLPIEIKTYIATHFPDQFIIEAKKNENDSIKAYEIRLDNMTDLEFNSDLEITDIDGITRIPESVISAKILNYVSINYPNNYITGWELDEGKQEVQLDNELDLEFNSDGDFLQIDLTP